MAVGLVAPAGPPRGGRRVGAAMGTAREQGAVLRVTTRSPRVVSDASDVAVAPMVVATAMLLAAGFALQLAFFARGGHVAISDLPRVLLHRGIGPGAFPYVDRA